MNIDEMIAVLQAAKEKKQMEFRSRSQHSEWHNMPLHFWDFEHYEYRVKPEPREIWIIMSNSGEPISPHSSRKGAERNARIYYHNSPVALFREVIE